MFVVLLLILTADISRTWPNDVNLLKCVNRKSVLVTTRNRHHIRKGLWLPLRDCFVCISLHELLEYEASFYFENWNRMKCNHRIYLEYLCILCKLYEKHNEFLKVEQFDSFNLWFFKQSWKEKIILVYDIYLKLLLRIQIHCSNILQCIHLKMGYVWRMHFKLFIHVC